MSRGSPGDCVQSDGVERGTANPEQSPGQISAYAGPLRGEEGHQDKADERGGEQVMLDGVAPLLSDLRHGDSERSQQSCLA